MPHRTGLPPPLVPLPKLLVSARSASVAGSYTTLSEPSTAIYHAPPGRRGTVGATATAVAVVTLPCSPDRLSLETILATPSLLSSFTAHLAASHADENIHFLVALQASRAVAAAPGVSCVHAGSSNSGNKGSLVQQPWDLTQAVADARDLASMFLSRASPLELNVSAPLRQRALAAISARERAVVATRDTEDDDRGQRHQRAADKENDAYAASLVGELLLEADALVRAARTLLPPPSPQTDGPAHEEIVDLAIVRQVGGISNARALVDLADASSAQVLASVAAFFAAFDELEAHVSGILLPRVRGWARELVQQQQQLTLTKVPTMTAKRVVIVGGGFCGAIVAKLLDPMDAFHVTLIDAKPFFEYTAAIVRLLSTTSISPITFPHSAYLQRGQLLLSRCTRITPTEVHLDGGGAVPFDYCVLATGSSYPSGIKAAATLSATYRARSLALDHERLRRARNVLVIGGGTVGVEIAAEIASVFGAVRPDGSIVPPVVVPPPSSSRRRQRRDGSGRGSGGGQTTRTAVPTVAPMPKRVTIVESNTSLLPQDAPKTGELALSYLRDLLGVTVVLGDRIVVQHKSTATGTGDPAAAVFRSHCGRTFAADIVYVCTGAVPNSACMRDAFAEYLVPDPPRRRKRSTVASAAVASAASAAGQFLSTGATPSEIAGVPGLTAPGAPLVVTLAAQAAGPSRVQVLDTHQVPDYPTVFVGGDCAATQEERLALSAKCAAVTIARNIVRLEKGKKPIGRGAKGTRPIKETAPIKLVSLGTGNGIGIVNGQPTLSPVYLHYKWNERQQLFLDWMQAPPGAAVPRTLQLLLGQPPNPIDPSTGPSNGGPLRHSPSIDVLASQATHALSRLFGRSSRREDGDLAHRRGSGGAASPASAATMTSASSHEDSVGPMARRTRSPMRRVDSGTLGMSPLAPALATAPRSASVDSGVSGSLTVATISENGSAGRGGDPGRSGRSPRPDGGLADLLALANEI
ncbi:hypothetical protein BC828DRAFT_414547 [Blastocladiella britannica]|nr:hypothetical protein BC828DRAFT_414547 [Blastocladiella britannica]